jgi:hypothetical protein
MQLIPTATDAIDLLFSHGTLFYFLVSYNKRVLISDGTMDKGRWGGGRGGRGGGSKRYTQIISIDFQVRVF